MILLLIDLLYCKWFEHQEYLFSSLFSFDHPGECSSEKMVIDMMVKKSKADHYHNLIDNNKGSSSELWKSLNKITS